MTETTVKPRVELMDFYADWCGPCHILGPILEEIEVAYKDRVDFQKIDVDQNPTLAGEYRVLSIPTLVFKKDGKVADQVIGVTSKDDLTKRLDSLLED